MVIVITSAIYMGDSHVDQPEILSYFAAGNFTAAQNACYVDKSIDLLLY